MDNKQKKIAFLGVLLMGCVATSWLQDGSMARQELPKPLVTKQAASDEGKLHKEKTIQVYVSGAVREPGIYYLPGGARAKDALEAAGGMREDARSDRVNLAKKLKDGSHVYVPLIKNYSTKQQAKTSKSKASGSSQPQGAPNEATLQTGWDSFGSDEGKLNLNTATQAELIALPGIGESMANRILALRRVRRFHKVDDLLQVRGIGQAKLEKLRPYVKVE